MKKRGLGVLAMAAVLAIAGCSCDKDKLTGVAKIVDDAKNYSVEELVELAKEETGKFTVYSTSSKTKNALEAFCAKYELTGCSKDNASSYNDYELYTKLTTEIEGNVKNGVDVALTQDGLTLKTTMVDTGYLINYNPVVDGAKASDLYSFMYYVKAIGQSNEATALTNIWELTETSNVNYFKSPLNELINMSFLTQLTTTAEAAKLATAYKEYKNVGDTELNAALTAGGYDNAGYMFVDKLLRNVNFNGSEGDIAKAIRDAEVPAYGFGAYGKYKGFDAAKYSIATNLKGYSYFVYNMYAQISKTTDRPYTAMLFINYISTKEGADFWAAKSVGPGAYSTNTKATSDQTETLKSILDNAVVEDVDAILSTPKTVEWFITNSVSENEK